LTVVNTVVTFSSLPPSEQFDAWHDAVSKAFVPLDATSRTEGVFGGTLANRTVGAVQISDVAGGAVDVYRSAQAIRRFDPGYLKLGMQLRGYGLVTQDGREAPLTLGAGRNHGPQLAPAHQLGCPGGGYPSETPRDARHASPDQLSLGVRAYPHTCLAYQLGFSVLGRDGLVRQPCKRTHVYGPYLQLRRDWARR
jgi:hypothetical protein